MKKNLDSIKHVIEAKNIADAFYKICEKKPEMCAYSQAIARDGDSNSSQARQKHSSTFSEIKSRVNKIAHFLILKEVRPNDKIAIISASRPEWMEADLAIMACSSVSVSVFQSLPADDIGYILYDSGAEVVFVENQEQLNKLKFLTLNQIKIPATEDRPATQAKLSFKAIIAFEQVEKENNVYHLKEICAAEEKQIPEQSKAANLDSLSALVYTSGIVWF